MSCDWFDSFDWFDSLPNHGPAMLGSAPVGLQNLGSAMRLAAAFALTLSILVAPVASAKDAPSPCRAKPLVVKIHADWCGSCKALRSVWERIETDLVEQAAAVTLDVSDRVAYGESQATAERLGIGEFFQEYRSRTGTIAVLDCNTREPVAIMSGERSYEKYRTAIARAGGTLQ